jgi:O-antigen ligase
MIFYLPVILFFLLVPIMNEALELPRSVALIILALLYVIAKPKSLAVKNKLFYLPFLIPITYLVSSFFNNQNILSALFGGYKRNFGILTYLAVAIIFVITLNLRLKDSSKFFKISLLPLSILSIIYSFIQLSGSDFLLWGEQNRVVLTIGNSNFAASYIAILLPSLLYGVATSRGKSLKSLYLALFFLLFYCGIQTKSFQFNVVALISISTFIFISFYHLFIKINLLLRTVGVFAIISTLIYSVFRFRNVLNDFTSADDRLSQQRAGLEMFTDNILFGVGVDGLQQYMPLYIRVEDIRREGVDIVPDKTHNAFVDHLANGGIFTGISYILFFILIFYFITKLLKTGEKYNVNLALPSAIFVAYVSQLFINTDSILNLVVPYISMGLIGGFYLNSQSEKSTTLTIAKKLLFIRIAAITSLILTLPLSVRIIVTDVQVRNIINSKYMDGDKIIEILRMWPNSRPTELVMIKYVQDLKNCPFVDRVSDRLLEVDRRSGQAWFVKSLCADAYNDQVTSLSFVKKAIEFQPVNVRYLDVQYQLEKFLGYEVEAAKTLSRINLILKSPGS